MQKLLIIGHHWPEPKSSAAGSRMLQLIKLFLEYNYKITFACASSKNANAEDLSSLNIEEVSVALNNSSFDIFVKELQPNIVVFDRFMTEEQFGWRIAENCPNAFRILNTEDIHSLRKGRQLALKANKPFSKEFLYNDVAKREIASIYRSDLSLIISEVEMDILKHDFKIPSELIHYLPFLLNTIDESKADALPKFEKREHFVTIGNFLHEPNYDAVLYLKTEIWNLIRKELPKAELHIYGAYTSEKVKQLHNEKQGFLIKGFAEDVNQVMQSARVCLAPLRFGAGLKGKLIDAMKNGIPCAMSTIAAEGMFGNLQPCGFIEDNPELFAKKTIALYADKDVWKDSQKQGFEIINKRFNKNAFSKDFIEKLEASISKIEELRLNNFTGQMLQHHTLQSTKFMSKWIEEKNKS